MKIKRLSIRLVANKEEDSHVGQHANENIDSSFDYGWYSAPLTNGFGQYPGYKLKESVASGHKATMVFCIDPTDHDRLPCRAGIHFPDISKGRIKPTVYARCATTNLWPVLRTSFAPIRFKE